MTAWRTIVTDSESRTGVAPACIEQDSIASLHGREDDGVAWADSHGVYDCCPGPHIELWSETRAADVEALLTETDAKEI
jgi:hypothetical protein